jgi:diacylglycerol kinase family enzyme
MKQFVDEFARSLAFICAHSPLAACEHSPLAAGRPLRWTVIANTAAGGFTIKKRLDKHRQALENIVKKAAALPARRASPSDSVRQTGGRYAEYGFYETAAAGDAAAITKNLLREADAAIGGAKTADVKPLFLIISAGGDGTALEILSEYTKRVTASAEKFLDTFVFLRLPMGTGNDGADAQSLEEALFRLIEPSGIKYESAITLTTAGGKGPFYAFNILSAGLDAFVTHWTNRMKGRLPGDSYKLWIDAASLFYNKIYKIGFMDICARDRVGNVIGKFHEKALLLAAGASGCRTYGAGNRILPDERNVCVMREMPVARKIAIKRLVTEGKHAACPEVLLFSAASVKFSCEYPILAQMDGETTLLKPEDFPAVIQVSEPLIPVLN